jgi:3',5'-cyclic AMP phosphodiesterase CpdA
MSLNKKSIYALFIAFSLSITACSSIAVSKAIPKIKTGNDMSLFITTDIHYLSKGLTDGKEAFQQYVKGGDGKTLDYIDEILNGLTYDIEKKKPEVLIVSGDLTNNGEKKSHLDLADKFKRIERLGTSVYVIPGNHDISNPWARIFKENAQYKTDTISKKEFSNIYEDFGYKEAVSRDKSTLSYLAAPSEDIWLLMLDTSQHENNNSLDAPQLDGRISAETYEWIKKCTDLAKRKKAQIITVMHHNLINHSEVIKSGFTLNKNEVALEKFQGFGLNLVLSGHIHIQDISSYKKDDYEVYDVVTNALSVYPNQYGVLKYSPSSGFDYSTSRVDVEGWAKEANIKDENINNFKEYSKKFFGDRAYSKSYFNAESMATYTDEEIDLMADTMRQLNLNYFAGTESVNSEELINSPGFRLWQDAVSSFSQSYVNSIVHDKDADDNKLHTTKASK